MEAVILSVGTELVLGQCVDTNSAWLADALTALGISVIRHETVGDQLADLTSAIRRSLAGANVLVLTGGLGPTLDDLTRQAIADALGVNLREDAEALETLRAFFKRWQRPMPESNRVQAQVPEGCTIIPNPRGTAPGILHIHNEKLLIALPGVPSEMKSMFEESIRPILGRRISNASIVQSNLLCFGISEAKLGDVLSDLMVRNRNPLVGTTASEAILTIRIVARGRDRDEAIHLASVDAAEIRERLGKVVFGEGQTSLSEAVGGELLRTGQTVAVAESCTGGLLGATLTDTPGSSRYFLRGYVTYADAAKTEMLGVPSAMLKEHGAVSEPVAAAMAVGGRAAAKSDFALSITGIAGPDGGSSDKPVGLVYIGLAGADGVNVHRYLFGDHLTRREIRDRSCKSALNLLRLRLIG